MSARPSRSYPWPVEGANFEDPEEASPSQMNMLPEYVPDYVSLETCSVCEAATGEDHSMALQSPYEAASQAMGTAMNEFSDNAIGVPDEVNQFWRGTFLENPSMIIEEMVPGNNASGVSDGTNQFWRGTFLENPSTTIEQTVPENNAIGVPDEVNQFWRGTFLENPSMTIEETIPEMSPAMQSPHEAAYQAMGTAMNGLSNNTIGVPDEVNQFWRGTFLENPSMTIEQTVPEMIPAMQSPHEAAYQAMGTAMNELSDNAIGVPDEVNQFWRGTFLENPSMTIEETVPENNAIGVPDEVNQFWRGTFLENPPMTIEERIPEMSPAMRSPSEAASDASSMTMNNSIDAEVTTTNSTFERVWELMERRRQQRRERVVAGIAEEDWNLDRLAEVFPTRFTDEQWVQLMTEFSAEECQRLFYVLELAYKRAIDSGGQTASVP
ncbi:hypothetical protein E4U56_007966 [Claviceps arundinis]|uniref:Uncharacterized protein n=1 Tax=Claviceps arundinis TaxID=1623583 RepID=A0A9P7MUZ3_9HYPO|nr:hypothetical protein E4U56_007966 [Claviceps arundinis]